MAPLERDLSRVVVTFGKSMEWNKIGVDQVVPTVFARALWFIYYTSRIWRVHAIQGDKRTSKSCCITSFVLLYRTLASDPDRKTFQSLVLHRRGAQWTETTRQGARPPEACESGRTVNKWSMHPLADPLTCRPLPWYHGPPAAPEGKYPEAPDALVMDDIQRVCYGSCHVFAVHVRTDAASTY